VTGLVLHGAHEAEHVEDGEAPCDDPAAADQASEQLANSTASEAEHTPSLTPSCGAKDADSDSPPDDEQAAASEAAVHPAAATFNDAIAMCPQLQHLMLPSCQAERTSLSGLGYVAQHLRSLDLNNVRMILLQVACHPFATNHVCTTWIAQLFCVAADALSSLC
jgi:hypothetical protein